MRILIFGCAGMLGHKLWLRLRSSHEAWATFRESRASDLPRPLRDMETSRSLFGCDVRHADTIEDCFRRANPEVVINAAGIVKQREDSGNPIPAIEVNSLFPHRLAACCAAAGARLIHISTDCVFSGRRGGYSEADPPDPVDVYGRSKLLGEVNAGGCLTIRTSLVGWELRHFSGLLEWFAAQRGRTVKGYRCAIFSGLATPVVADLLNEIVLPNGRLAGVRHIASTPIAKYDLLDLLRKRMGWHDVALAPDAEVECDRSLDGTLFRHETEWNPPSWERMVDSLAVEHEEYMEWRKR